MRARRGARACGVLSTSVKGRVVTRPRDIPYGAAPVGLVWHKRRWRCREQACPRGSFTESHPGGPGPGPAHQRGCGPSAGPGSRSGSPAS